MKTPLYLTRARLRRDPAIAAIGTLLLPESASARISAAHQLIWSFFAGDPEAKRDFLWREEKQEVFYILSPRPPGESPVFEAETKAFAPNLTEGDFLRFSLRANATRSHKSAPGTRGKRADVVMAALKPVPKGQERIEARPDIVSSAGKAWLMTQGKRHGFVAETCVVDGYDQLKLPRNRSDVIKIGVLEFEGLLRVTSPEAFLSALAQGFGHAKAFGCGLMLIRRA